MSAFFAVAPRGTERVLADELRLRGVTAVDEQRGGVAFGTRLEDAYLVCLWSRVASRVLYPLHSFDALDAGALYDGVRSVDWVQHLGADTTMAVDVAGKNAPAGPGHFIALKTKDAIVDRIRDAEGARPDVDTAQPDVRVHVHVNRAQVTVSIDLSGRGLHRRGMDRDGAAAPLKENLAAAILRLAGWPERDPSCPFFDPMCGSGTLLMEAAWMALDVAPGATRTGLAATGWRGHDPALWQRLLQEATEAAQAAAGRELHVCGADASEAAVRTARENLRRAGLASRVQVERRALNETGPPSPEPGLLVTNPPYGERLGETDELGPVYELLGDVLKRRFGGWSAWVFTGNPQLGKRIGLRPASRQVLFNGPIESRLLEIPISDTPVAPGGMPGWRRASPESQALVTRLRKNLRRLRPWARREQVTCYRLYDADVPEYNVAIDWYDGAVRVEEYPRPRKVAVGDAERRLRDTLLVVPETLAVEPESVVRARRPHSDESPHRRDGDDRRHIRTVSEHDLHFEVDLEGCPDTGLALDHRRLRQRIRRQAKACDVLDLFAGTCTVSLAAAVGGARSTTSVDSSASALAWGRRNFALNALGADVHRFACGDELGWLANSARQRYDLICLSPPPDSSVKTMQTHFDIQRDHVRLIPHVGGLLEREGEMLFVTRARGFILDTGRITDFVTREITDEVATPDFERRPRLRVWSVRRA